MCERAADADDQASLLGVIFHPATGVDADVDSDAVGELQACLRRRILRVFVGRGLLESWR